MMLPIDLLKLFIFLFYATISCLVVYIVVYLKTYTSGSYDEIGTLITICWLTGAIVKPVICSTADRHNNYKQCMMIALTVMLVSSLPQIFLPFYPQLLFDEPHPRLIWYMLAGTNLIEITGISVCITLTDVFVIHKCINSTKGEYFGAYRFYGVLGWAACSICLALMEHYLHYPLPPLFLPMAFAPVLIILDLIIVYHLEDIKRKDKRISMVTTVSDEYLNMGGGQQVVQMALSKPMPPILEPNHNNQLGNQILKRTSESSIRSSISYFEKPVGGDSSIQKGNDNYDKIAIGEQFNLLCKLNYYDNFNLVKYLATLIIMGAFSQIHYLFYLQYMSEILNERNLSMILFTFSAALQVSSCTGESLGLLFIARLVQTLGRDLTLVVCFTISGLRYAIAGYLVDYLNIWVLAMIDIQTGIMFGINYTLMTETGACYLSILDKLLLIDTDSTSTKEDEFVTYLEQMKESHSIESIRFALKATIQSLFSCSMEGFGFALGSLFAGFWLNLRDDSIRILYQDLVNAHLIVLCSLILLEFGIIRWLLDARSRIDKMKICP